MAAIGFAQRTREHAALSHKDRVLFLTKKEKAGFFLFCPVKGSGFDVLFSAPDGTRQLLSGCGSRYLHPSQPPLGIV